jgi:hypothetical protein
MSSIHVRRLRQVVKPQLGKRYCKHCTMAKFSGFKPRPNCPRCEKAREVSK